MRATRAERTPGARIVLVLLALATAVALLLAGHLKGRLPLIDGAGVVWHPSAPFNPSSQTPSFSFTSDYRDVLRVSIIAKPTGRTVTVIRRALRVYGHGHRTPTLHWDARGTAPGTYEVEVHFAHLNRTVLIPTISFTLR